MGQRRQVPAGADRSPFRHARVHPVIEQGDQRLERFDADTRESLGQHVGAQRHRGAYGAHRQRVAQPGRVTSQQIGLQRFERGGRNLHFSKRSESGVDAVHGLLASRLAIDHGACRLDAGDRRGRQADRFAGIGNAHELFDGERGTV